MTSHYTIEAEHERRIMERYQKAGYETIRSAASKGASNKAAPNEEDRHDSFVDIICWNEKEILLIASQHVPWQLKKQKWSYDIFKKRRPPNSKLLFIGIYGYVERQDDADELAEKYGWEK